MKKSRGLIQKAMTMKDKRLLVFTNKLPQVRNHDTFKCCAFSQEHSEAHPKVQTENTGVRSNAGNCITVFGNLVNGIEVKRQMVL